MTKEVLFIDTEYIKNNSIINDNVDNELIIPFITLAQDKYIETLIGTRLFRKLEDDISGDTVSGIYKTILNNYIARTLKEWVIYEAMPFLNFKITNKSILKKDGDNSESADLSELRYLRNGIRDSAEYYSERLRRYLIENQSSIKEYPDQLSGVDKIHPESNNIFQGLYLG